MTKDDITLSSVYTNAINRTISYTIEIVKSLYNLIWMRQLVAELNQLKNEIYEPGIDVSEKRKRSWFWWRRLNDIESKDCSKLLDTEISNLKLELHYLDV
jgi:hypothetical protein